MTIHPQSFVNEMVLSNRTDVVIDVANRFAKELSSRKTAEHKEVYNFANAFLVSVLGQLELVKSGESFEDDPVLTVWRELGLFGIEREEIVRINLANGRDGLPPS